ncbi:MAG: alpha/beta fold hydrolase [Steroidobacterales bacterium]
MSSLYTEVRGSGPTLVLLHGWGLNVRVWDGLAAALCDRLRIIAVDLPGHGRSPWLSERSSLGQQAVQVGEAVAAIADEYSLLGWSFGGQIALQLAAGQGAACAAGAVRSASTQPSSAAALDRLVLIATTPRFVAGPDWHHGSPPERLAAQAQGLETDYRRTVSDFLELQVRGSAGGAEVLEQLRTALFAHGSQAVPASRDRVSHGRPDAQSTRTPGPLPAALACDLELLRDNDLRPLLPDISLPTLVIAGQYDRVTHPAASRALADRLPNARYVEVRRAGHAPFLSHLPQLSALLADFLLQ